MFCLINTLAHGEIIGQNVAPAILHPIVLIVLGHFYVVVVSGTSNWSGDYFISTGGIGLIINQTSSKNIDRTVRQQLADIFARDWNSSFAHPISTFLNVDIKHGLK